MKDGNLFRVSMTDGISSRTPLSGGKLSALVTSRYHAAVLSMETGCPIIAVSMDERLDGLMKEISMDERFLFHTTEKALGRKIFNALEEADSGKEEIRKQILRQVMRNRKEIIRMGIFLHTYLVTGPDGSRGESRCARCDSDYTALRMKRQIW